MQVGRLQVMLSYSDTPDAPVAPTTQETLHSQEILIQFKSVDHQQIPAIRTLHYERLHSLKYTMDV